jgi:hypothetical protein
MSHSEIKKSTKKENKKPAKPELIHEDEIEKHKTKGLIGGV